MAHWAPAEAQETTSVGVQPPPAADNLSAARLAAALQLLENLHALPLDSAASETPDEAAAAAGQEAVRKLLNAAGKELKAATDLELEASSAVNDANLATAEAERLQKCTLSTL